MILSQAPKNKKLIIEQINCSDTVIQKLMNLGVFNEAIIIIRGSAPLGDPMIIEVNDNLIAIRKAEAQNIIASVIKAGDEK